MRRWPRLGATVITGAHSGHGPGPTPRHTLPLHATVVVRDGLWEQLVRDSRGGNREWKQKDWEAR